MPPPSPSAADPGADRLPALAALAAQGSVAAAAAAGARPVAWSGPTLALLGAIAFSAKAIIVKLAYRHGVDPVTLIMLRMLIALPFFLLMAWYAGRGKPALTRQDMLAVTALGFSGYYLASMLDFWGLLYISAGLERLILYLSPAMVLLLSWLLHGQRATRVQLWALLVGYAGIVLVFGHELQLEGLQVLTGGALVMASTLSYALYLIYSGRWVQRLGALRLTGLASTAACVFCLLHFAAVRPLAVLDGLAPEVWWLSLLNGTVCTVAPVLMVMMAIERMGASRTAQFGMVGPVSTILMGVLLLGETFTGWMAAGTALVLASVTLLARWR